MSNLCVAWTKLFVGLIVLTQAFKVLALEVKIGGNDGVSVKVGGNDGVSVKVGQGGDFGFGKVIERISSITGRKSDGPSCLKILGQAAYNGLPAVFTCLVDMQLTSRKMNFFSPCLAKCAGQKTKIFDKDGLLDLTYVRQLIEKLPPQMREIVMDIAEQCLDQVFAVKANDETCESYKPLLNCTQTSALQRSDKIINSCSDIPDAFKQVASWVRKTFNGADA